MAVTLHTAGRAHARSLVDQGKVDEESAWDFTGEDGNSLLGDPPDWKGYASWFLGHDTAEDAETKAAWKYPFGKDGKLYRSAVRAIRTRASQQNETEISEAARALLDMLDERGTQDVLAKAPERPSAGTRDWYRITAEGNAPETADLHVYDAIGSWYDGVTAKQFVTDLAKLPQSIKTIRVHVNSPGGDVFDALAIANALRQHPAAVEMSIEGLAASAATIITNGGGDSIKIAENALVMIHNPFGFAVGTARDMRNVADALDRSARAIVATYQRHSPLAREELASMMEAVTWMDADEALANGFATEKVEGLKAAASIDPRAVLEISIPEKYMARVAALLKEPADLVQDAPAPAPAEPPRADAATVLQLCARAGLDIDFAQALLGEELTPALVEARVSAEVESRQRATDRAAEIRAVCSVAGQDDLADDYVSGGMTVDQVRAHLTKVTAKLDKAEIDAGLAPDHGTRRKTIIDVVAVYAERNRLKN